MLNKVSAHLYYTLDNNIFTRKNSPRNIYLFIVNSSNIRKRCEIYSKLTIKTPEPKSLTHPKDRTKQINLKNKEFEFVTQTPMHPRDRLKRNSKNKLINKKVKNQKLHL